jgi:hypothetical protein
MFFLLVHSKFIIFEKLRQNLNLDVLRVVMAHLYKFLIKSEVVSIMKLFLLDL